MEVRYLASWPPKNPSRESVGLNPKFRRLRLFLLEPLAFRINTKKGFCEKVSFI